MEALNLLLVGVGGQGVVLASDVVAEAGLSAGYDVKKTDTLGMAQRGGSVVSHVRLAQQVYSPLIREGEVDIILAFEKLEAVRWLSYLRPGGTVLVNNKSVPPLSVSLGVEAYPSDLQIINALKQVTDRVFLVEGEKRARELGNVRTLNVFMLGCASVFMPLDPQVWRECLQRMLPERIRDINLAAFDLGRKEFAGADS